MKTTLLIWFILLSAINAQEAIAEYTVDCDSIYNADNETGPCTVIEKLPESVKSFKDIQNEFFQLTGTGNSDIKMVVKVIIDTLGNVRCPVISKSTSSQLDSILLDYVSSIKIYSCNKWR